MLSFSQEQVVFEFIEKKHLEAHIDIKNISNMLVCYKFRVNRPKFYLLKPDRGHLQPKQTKRITITLHKDGVSDSFDDRFKCFFVFLADGIKIENYSGIEDRSDAEFKRLPVKVSKLPLGMEMSKAMNMKVGDPTNSELKSLGNAGSNHFKGGDLSGSTYEGAIHEKQKKRATLKSQIEEMNKTLTAKKRRQKLEGKSSQHSSPVNLILMGVIGVVLGVISSLWI